MYWYEIGADQQYHQYLEAVDSKKGALSDGIHHFSVKLSTKQI